jgi:hypothetical protein
VQHNNPAGADFCWKSVELQRLFAAAQPERELILSRLKFLAFIAIKGEEQVHDYDLTLLPSCSSS